MRTAWYRCGVCALTKELPPSRCNHNQDLLTVGYGLFLKVDPTHPDMGTGVQVRVDIGKGVVMTSYCGIIMNKTTAEELRSRPDGFLRRSHLMSTHGRHLVIDGYRLSAMINWPIVSADGQSFVYFNVNVHGRNGMQGFGAGSMINHNPAAANVVFVKSPFNHFVGIRALRDIHRGEFLYVKYPSFFVNSCKSNIRDDTE